MYSNEIMSNVVLNQMSYTYFDGECYINLM